MTEPLISKLNRPVGEFHQLVRWWGTAAQRPTTNLVLNQAYLNVDVPEVEYYNGSSWVAVSGGGGGISTATLPLAISGSNITIAATTTNDGGTVVKQASTPGTAQTGNINISGKVVAGTANLSGNMTSGSLSTGSATASSLAATGTVSGNFLQSSGNIQATAGPYFLGSIPILDRGGTFPTSGLLDGQRYWHTTYRAWFVYNSTDVLWRQEAPGVFGSSFPTVAAGDNTVAPKIEVKRTDRNNLVYFWNGTDWLGPQVTTLISIFPSITTNAFTANTNNVFFDAHPDGASDVYVEAIQSAAFVNALNSGNTSTSFWVYTYRFRNSAAATSITGSANTSTFTVATLTPIVLLSNTKVTRTNFYDLFIDVAKGGATGTPGTLFVDPMKFVYRLCN